MKKRIGICVLLLAVCIFSCGCKTKEERELEKAIQNQNNAMQHYQKALDDYNELRTDIQRYEDLVESLENAR